MVLMASGLAKSLEKVSDDKNLFFKHLSKNDDVFELIKQKGQFRYHRMV
jgi:hypothetical protein